LVTTGRRPRGGQLTSPRARSKSSSTVAARTAPACDRRVEAGSDNSPYVRRRRGASAGARPTRHAASGPRRSAARRPAPST
jgi:hypothetical protein